MRDLLFAIRRLLRPGLILCLVLAAALPILARNAGSRTSLRPCGLYCDGTGEAYEDLSSLLESDGFIVYESRESLVSDVSSGKLNCGAVLEAGLEDRLLTDTLSGAVTLYLSSMSYLPEIPEAQLQARLYTASAVARTEKAAKIAGAEVEDGSIEAELDALYAQGKLFSFEVHTVSGAAADSGEAVGSRLAKGACALLFFTSLLPAVRREVRNSLRMVPRIGAVRSLLHLLLPSLAVLLLLSMCAGLAAGMPPAGLAAYLFCLLSCGLLYAPIPEKAAGALLTLWVIGSLALMPVWMDLADYVPAAETLRLLFPPALFSKILENPRPCAAASVLLSAVLIPALRRCRNA